MGEDGVKCLCGHIKMIHEFKVGHCVAIDFISDACRCEIYKQNNLDYLELKYEEKQCQK